MGERNGMVLENDVDTSSINAAKRVPFRAGEKPGNGELTQLTIRQ